MVFFLFLCFFCSLQKICYDKVKDARLAKLVWQLPCHILCSLVGLYVADQQAGMNMLVSNYDSDPLNSYAFYYAYWMAVVIEFVISSKDVDSKMMAFHHIATMAALVSSDYLGLRQIGLHVLLLHDSSDVWIMTLKLCFKLKMRDDLQILIYCLCMFVWIYTRIYLFSYQLCYNLIFYHSGATHLVPTAMLYFLAGCNLVWTYMLLKLPFSKSVVETYENIPAPKINRM